MISPPVKAIVMSTDGVLTTMTLSSIAELAGSPPTSSEVGDAGVSDARGISVEGKDLFSWAYDSVVGFCVL